MLRKPFDTHHAGAQAVLMSETLELQFFGILSDEHKSVHSMTISRVPHKGRRRRLLLSEL